MVDTTEQWMQKIEQRLAQIEEERALLLRLWHMYSGGRAPNGSPQRELSLGGAAAPTNGEREFRLLPDIAKPKTAPSDILPPNKKLGPSEAVMYVVRQAGSAGVDPKTLLDRAMPITDSKARDKRALLSWVAADFARRGKNIVKRDNRYFLLEGSA